MTTLLGRIFAERKQTGSLDLEAVEMAFRAALHQAGAAALTQLLQFPEPAEQRNVPCPCGHQANFREVRPRHILTALGKVELRRPPGFCVHTVMRASFLSIANWTSKIATVLRECAVCRLWWVRSRHSITVVSK